MIKETYKSFSEMKNATKRSAPLPQQGLSPLHIDKTGLGWVVTWITQAERPQRPPARPLNQRDFILELARERNVDIR